MSWRIYYDGGVVEHGDVQTLPRERLGVVVVAQSDGRVGRAIISGHDWYYRRDGVWYGADSFGLMDQVMYHLGEVDCVMQGRMVDGQTFEDLQIRACDDPGLPRKSAHRKGELR